MNIVFVCTGNTCRSPMAEGIFKSKIAQYTDTCHVSSCGLSVMPGDAASYEAVQVMADRGVDITAHRSRQINPYIIDEADYVICLAKSHYDALFPVVERNKRMLLGNGIADPYMGNYDVYARCADAIAAAIDELLNSDIFFRIDKMNENDIDAIADIENSAFSDPWSKNSFLAERNKPYGIHFVCRYLDKVVGYVFAEDICGEVCINNVAVVESMRQRKIADKLLYEIEDYCKQQNSSLITLEVRESNTPAINLYKKHGFEIIGKRKNFYTKPNEDGYIMTKYLNGD